MQAQRNPLLLDRVSGTATFRAIEAVRVLTIEYEDRAFAFSGEQLDGQSQGAGGGPPRPARTPATLRDKLRQTRARMHPESAEPEPEPEPAPEPSASEDEASGHSPQVELDWDPEGPETEIDLDEVVRTMRIPRDRLAVDAPARDDESQVARVNSSKPELTRVAPPRSLAHTLAGVGAEAPSGPSIRFSEEPDPTRRTRHASAPLTREPPREREVTEETTGTQPRPREESAEYARPARTTAARSSSLPPPPMGPRVRVDETKRTGRIRRDTPLHADRGATAQRDELSRTMASWPEPVATPSPAVVPALVNEELAQTIESWREPTQRTLHSLADDAARILTPPEPARASMPALHATRLFASIEPLPPLPSEHEMGSSRLPTADELAHTVDASDPNFDRAESPTGFLQRELSPSRTTLPPLEQSTSRLAAPSLDEAQLDSTPRREPTSPRLPLPPDETGRIARDAAAFAESATAQGDKRVHHREPTDRSRNVTRDEMLPIRVGGPLPHQREPEDRSRNVTRDEMRPVRAGDERTRAPSAQATPRADQRLPGVLSHAREPTGRTRQVTRDQLLPGRAGAERVQPREPTGRTRNVTRDDVIPGRTSAKTEPHREPTERSRNVTRDDMPRVRAGTERALPPEPPDRSRNVTRDDMPRVRTGAATPPPIPGARRTTLPPPPPRGSQYQTGRSLQPVSPASAARSSSVPPPPTRSALAAEYDAMWDGVQPGASPRRSTQKRALNVTPADLRGLLLQWQQKPWFIPAAASAALAFAGAGAAVMLRGPASFDLDLEISPADAQISIDGRVLEPVSGPRREHLPLGQHALAIKKPGFVSEQRVITADKRGSVQQLQLRLTAEKRSAALSVSSIPSGATIKVDGSDTGQVTPAALRDLPLGAHAVSLHLNGYVTAEQAVRLPEDALVSISLVAAAPVQPPPPPPAPAREIVRAPAAPAAPLSEALLARRALVRAARATCRQNARDDEPFDREAEAVLRAIGESCLTATTPAVPK